MTAQAALRTALREVLGPNARDHGYRGSAPTWRKSNSVGDWMVVNVQSSSSSNSDALKCVINIAAAPEPWLRWQRFRLGSNMPKSIAEFLGLYRDRLHPTGTPVDQDGWWEIKDQVSATDVVADMVTRLEASGWALLESLLARDRMLERVRRGDLGFAKGEHFREHFAAAEALLLMDQGPSDALDACLTGFGNDVTSAQRANPEKFDNWVRAQAQQSAP
ncbi:DUF4304 domain-containing protein [Agromyces sp. NPDC055520]